MNGANMFNVAHPETKKRLPYSVSTELWQFSLYDIILLYSGEMCIVTHQIPFFADTRNPSTTFASGVTYADQFLW